MTTVKVHKDGPIWTVVIDRPEVRNAVDGPTAAALAQAFREFDRDERARAAVLTGAGAHFCAGADLATVGSAGADLNAVGSAGAGLDAVGSAGAGLDAVGTERGNRTEPGGDAPMGPTRMMVDKPVIAAVSGYAVAGGLELALWCDLRVADETAVFGVFCRRFGVPLIDGGTVRLPRLVGQSVALDMVLTGRPVDAVEAKQIGLANRLVPAGEALRTAQRLAAELAALPQVALRGDRRSVYGQHGRSIADAMAVEFEYGMAALAGQAQEGAARFRAGAGRHGSKIT